MTGKMFAVNDCFKGSDLPGDDELARLEYGGYQRTVRSQWSTGMKKYDAEMG